MAEQNPIYHSMDNDAFHFPGNVHFDVHAWTSQHVFDGRFGLTKFMVMELAAALICLFTFTWLAWNVRRYGYARGRLANLLETMLVFVRDQIAVPAIGHHDAHHFLPYLWTLFFFILTNNLLGMLPWMGSATAALGCTAALALCSFITIHGGGVVSLGPGGYAKAFVPSVPLALYPLMFVVELMGHAIKPAILAFRLFINMLAGHTVLFVILSFIAMAQGSIYFVVAPVTVLGVVVLSMLELFVAFLQAYVFTFLSALFIGAAVHPHH